MTPLNDLAYGKAKSASPEAMSDTRITGTAPNRSLKRPETGPNTIAVPPYSAKMNPARPSENPSSRVRYKIRNGRIIIPARLIRFVAKSSQTSRGNPARPRHGFSEADTNENGHFGSGRLDSRSVGSVVRAIVRRVG